MRVDEALLLRFSEVREAAEKLTDGEKLELATELDELAARIAYLRGYLIGRTLDHEGDDPGHEQAAEDARWFRRRVRLALGYSADCPIGNGR